MKLSREKNAHKKLPHHGKDGFKHASLPRTASCSVSCMQALSTLKGGTLIDLVIVPHGKDHTYPDICQGANGHAVALALGPFALIICLGPRFLLCREPGELVQGVAQGFQASKTHMN